MADRMAQFARGLERVRTQCQASRAEFFTRVMVDPENPTRRMRCAPHQRLSFAFMEAHQRGCLRMPTDTGKTITVAADLLFSLGRDPNLTALLVGKTEQIAKRSLRFARTYLEEPHLRARLNLVWPDLRLTDSDLAARTNTSITVERPAGGADPSVEALGLGTAAQGKKPRRAICDDVLDLSNTQTKAQRLEVTRRFQSQVVSRLVGEADSRVYLVNVPWHELDLTFELEELGWPILHYDILGNVRLANTEWDTPLLRESRKRPGWYRLAEHDSPAYARWAGVTLPEGTKEWVDEDEQIPLFPERWPADRIHAHRYGGTWTTATGEKVTVTAEPASEFARSRLCQPMADEEQRCKLVWIDGGKDEKTGREYDGCKFDGAPVTRLDEAELGRMPVFVGVDFAWGEEEDSDLTSFFVLGILPGAERLILNIESERGMTGPDVIDRLLDLDDRYEPKAFLLETVAAQKYLLQFAKRERAGIKVQGFHTTQARKLDRLTGIETLFAEFEGGVWRIPSSAKRVCAPEVQAFVDECLAYRPGKHVGDRLIAGWLARQAASRLLRSLDGRQGQVPRARTTTERADVGKLNAAKWTSTKGYSMGRGRGRF